MLQLMLLRCQSISYFNVKHTIWLKGYQNGNHTKPSEQRLQDISIAKNWPQFLTMLILLATVFLTALCGCCFGNP